MYDKDMFKNDYLGGATFDIGHLKLDVPEDVTSVGALAKSAP